ncbi:MAG: ferrous iron transport protein B [Anaerolineaceae bacterium 4572_78]|nr:MAG: ferrous iron transport protein B [Anaerolineaceae bacterium 4572_78]
MHHHDSPNNIHTDNVPVVLIGNPNVGKSVIFGALTGRHVIIANYPGTTVEFTQGTFNLNGKSRSVIDTPGIHSIVPFSDDERVTRDILFSNKSSTIIQVADTKNLRRGLLISLELAEVALPFILTLNMADEAKIRGIKVDIDKLSSILGIPVVSTVATSGEGIQTLVHAMDTARTSTYKITYSDEIEEAITQLETYLPQTTLSRRSMALMILVNPSDLLGHKTFKDVDHTAIYNLCRDTKEKIGHPLPYSINRQRLKVVDDILKNVVQHSSSRRFFLEEFGYWTVHPVAGWAILSVMLYVLYLFVGVLGAGTLVDLLEVQLFENIVNPWLTWGVETLIPIKFIQDFLVGDYGMFTMAITYSLAIVLPIVGTFFFAFSILEDSGYLPRLAVMLNRAFQWIGLNGKAVLPMILGLGCTTMATVTTRILETRKERLQVTLLLALGVPCSAQLGVMLGMIADLGTTATVIWGSVVMSTLLAVGYLANQVIPGQKSDFIFELPPMRVPSLSNILMKTLVRLEWYLKEVIPIFVLGTAILFILDKISLLYFIEQALAPLITGWLNLPIEVTGAFLIGFLRRDYGAAGLFALSRDGLMSPLQILVSLVVITLFMPCVANVLMIVKEYGVKFAIAVAAFVFPFAIVVGGLLNLVLRYFNIM